MWEGCGTIKWKPPTPRKSYQEGHVLSIKSEHPTLKKPFIFGCCKIQGVGGSYSIVEKLASSFILRLGSGTLGPPIL